MQEPLLSNRAVLVVEDNSINQFLVQHSIKKLGGAVDFAVSGVEAVEKIKAKKYDLVLMDIQLPEMDGYEASTVIRNTLKSDVPIIAMTAFALNGENEKCLQYGMNSYLSKPFAEDDLYLAIEKVLETSKELVTNPYILQADHVEVDISMLYEVAGDDPSYIAAMVSTFLETLPATIKKMEDSFAAEDYETLYKSAHYSKSSLSIIKISDTYNIAQSIEKIAKSQTGLSELPFLLKDFRDKFTVAEKVLSKKFASAA